MEGIVQDMEEETHEDDQQSPEIKKGEKSKPKLLPQKTVIEGADVKTKLLTEILEFHDKKLQLKRTRAEEEVPVMTESKTLEEIISLEDKSERYWININYKINY